MRPEDQRLVRQVRRAPFALFADRVKVDGLPMSRATARMIERNLTCSARGVAAA